MKFSKDVTCVCNGKLSINHILLEFEIFKQIIREKNILISVENYQELFSGSGLTDIAKLIQFHPIIKLL
jgi:hypothetical protein